MGQGIINPKCFSLDPQRMGKKGSGEGFGGRADASDTRGLWFESHLNVIEISPDKSSSENMKIKQKEKDSCF